MAERIPASTQTHQRLTGLLERGVADGDARAELIKLAVRKIVDEIRESIERFRQARNDEK